VTLIQACLNGPRPRGEHPALPLSPASLARAARAAVAAGARSLHVHVRDHHGAESLAADDVSATLAAIRAAVPGIEISLSTGLWITDGNVSARAASVASWSVVPELVSLNLREAGWNALGALLASRGVGIEAGLASVADAEALADAAVRVHRVLVEPETETPEAAVSLAAAIDDALDAAGHTRPRLHHGKGSATWAVLDAAVARGHDVRIGLEDVLTLADDTAVPGNAALVAAAVVRYAGGARWPPRSPPAAGSGDDGVV
jgi:uncharacterized protein (DUF849 family)